MDQASIVTLHPEAAKRCDQLSQDILQTVKVFEMKRRSQQATVDVYPAYTVPPEDILSGPKFMFEVDELGDRVGVLWMSENMRVGWTNATFQPIKDLVRLMARCKSMKNLVSDEFLMDETVEWLRGTLERKRGDTLSDYIARRCQTEIKTYEIWMPIFRTYSTRQFNISDVTFQTISKAIMDEWWSRIPPHVLAEPAAINALKSKRSKLQGALAACVTVRAERIKAVQLAKVSGKNALSLLRFLSPANLNSRLTSYSSVSESAMLSTAFQLFVKESTIQEIQQGVDDKRQSDWDLDAAIELRPGVLEAIADLALNTSTEFRENLYDALILYARQSQATELSDKLLFTTAALESMLLRDSNEPIQKNLGERMAFLIGQSIDERKQIVENVDVIYKARSAFVHHGQTPRDQEALDYFLPNAWATFGTLLGLVKRCETKAALISLLEDRKMA
jgi:hypothetical protein